MTDLIIGTLVLIGLALVVAAIVNFFKRRPRIGVATLALSFTSCVYAGNLVPEPTPADGGGGGEVQTAEATPTPPPSPAPSPSPTPPPKASVFVAKGEWPVSVSEEIIDEFVRSVRAGDPKVYSDLLDQGYMRHLPPGTVVERVSVKPWKELVEIRPRGSQRSYWTREEEIVEK